MLRVNIWVLVNTKGVEKMNLLKNINLYNLIRLIIILLMVGLAPIVTLANYTKKYVKCPLSKLIKTFNI